MYPKRRVLKEPLFNIASDLDVYLSEEAISKRMNEGDLNPRDAAILRGVLTGNIYEEDEEE